jgi:hypothetical protein
MADQQQPVPATLICYLINKARFDLATEGNSKFDSIGCPVGEEESEEVRLKV